MRYLRSIVLRYVGVCSVPYIAGKYRQPLEKSAEPLALSFKLIRDGCKNLSEHLAGGNYALGRFSHLINLQIFNKIRHVRLVHGRH